MSYEEILKEIESAKKINKPVEALSKMIEERFDLSKMDCIQVAGTNGKGSTIAWMASMAPKKTGVFVSPHLISHLERIRIDGNEISQADFCRLYEKNRSFFMENGFSMFECDLWIALEYFAEKNVRLAFWETGLGGGKDAVTAIPCKVKALTNIGMDHMELLGGTLEEIAASKAGMFRKGVPVFTTEAAMFSVLKKSADTTSCDLIAVEIEGDLSPAYQNANFSLAKAVMHSLGYEKQLRPFVWPARFQKLAENPDVILDGAHNLPGVRALLQSVPENCVFYASFLKEKQAQEMIALLHTKGEVKLVSFEDERLADLNAFSLPVLTMEQMQKEIESRTKPCVICGSLHFAGKVLACLA